MTESTQLSTLPPQQRAVQASGDHALTERLNDLLPQTQCTRCGYPQCRDYARALAAGETALNRCPPGGSAGIAKLAQVLQQPELPLDPSCGTEGPRLLAWIDPVDCIGCTKCILACPTDAIIGGPKRMHTVLPALCTGCELCVPPCPVDCIELTPSPDTSPWTADDAAAARQRFEQRNARRQRQLEQDHERFGAEAGAKMNELEQQAGTATDPALDKKKAVIAAAMARAEQRRQQRRNATPPSPTARDD